jgi:hypothetical protein
VLLSVFWNWFTVPDLMHEPLGAAMRNTTSATRAFMAAYFGDIVDVAAAYPAAAARWELGNELNLIADLNLTGSDVSIAPSLGTPKFRTSADNFSTSDMIDFETWLAATMRTAASAKGLPTIISTGHAIPRRCADHLQRSYHAPQRDWSPHEGAVRREPARHVRLLRALLHPLLRRIGGSVGDHDAEQHGTAGRRPRSREGNKHSEQDAVPGRIR